MPPQSGQWGGRYDISPSALRYRSIGRWMSEARSHRCRQWVRLPFWFSVNDLSTMTTVYRMWLANSRRKDWAWEEQALNDDLLQIGFHADDERMPNLSGYGREEIKNHLERVRPELSNQQTGFYANQLHRFITLKRGDLVLVVLRSRSRRVAVGEIAGSYIHRAKMPVKWLRLDIRREDLCADLLKLLEQQPTIIEVQVSDAVARVRAMVETGRDPGPTGRRSGGHGR